MNERVKQIALECYNPYSNFDHEKFAELIVRECIRAFNDDGYQTEYEQDLKVLKHFGVE
jgi:hypothetical protein